MRGCLRRKGKMIAISIHAPRGGSDHIGIVLIAAHTDFNPRSPGGGATVLHIIQSKHKNNRHPIGV